MRDWSQEVRKSEKVLVGCYRLRGTTVCCNNWFTVNYLQQELVYKCSSKWINCTIKWVKCMASIDDFLYTIWKAYRSSAEGIWGMNSSVEAFFCIISERWCFLNECAVRMWQKPFVHVSWDVSGGTRVNRLAWKLTILYCRQVAYSLTTSRRPHRPTGLLSSEMYTVYGRITCCRVYKEFCLFLMGLRCWIYNMLEIL